MPKPVCHPWSMQPFLLEYLYLYEKRGHSGIVYSLHIQDSIVVSGSGDSTVRLWDLRTNTSQFCLKNHTDSVRSVKLVDHKLSTSGGKLLFAVVGVLYFFLFTGWSGGICRY